MHPIRSTCTTQEPYTIPTHVFVVYASVISISWWFCAGIGARYLYRYWHRQHKTTSIGRLLDWLVCEGKGQARRGPLCLCCACLVYLSIRWDQTNTPKPILQVFVVAIIDALYHAWDPINGMDCQATPYMALLNQEPSRLFTTRTVLYNTLQEVRRESFRAPISWLAGLLVGWLVGWLIGWLVG